jgi:hypothetical protein
MYRQSSRSGAMPRDGKSEIHRTYSHLIINPKLLLLILITQFARGGGDVAQDRRDGEETRRSHIDPATPAQGRPAAIDVGNDGEAQSPRRAGDRENDAPLLTREGCPLCHAADPFRLGPSARLHSRTPMGLLFGVGAALVIAVANGHPHYAVR